MPITIQWLLSELERLLHEYETRFSANDPHSELMAVNHAAGQHPVVVDPELYELIKIGKYHSCAEDSHLNIAIGPSCPKMADRILPDAKSSHPQVAALLPLTDPQQIRLNEERAKCLLGKTGNAARPRFIS